MKARPILFSAEMVRAILCGRKSVTRRVVTPQPELGDGGCWYPEPPRTPAHCARHYANERRLRKGLAIDFCPYGQPGDILWVREEHFRLGHWEPVETKRTRTGKQKWRFVPDPNTAPLFSPPQEGYRMGRSHEDPRTPAWHKRLARFMPRAIARISLEVVDVRVERLHEITEEDAQAEGVEPVDDPFHEGNEFWACYAKECLRDGGCAGVLTARESFKTLWDSIGRDRHGASWDDEPWVWRVAFRRPP